jgi:hypothetical protein
MPDPFNYNIASPMAAFEGSLNFAQAQEQRRAAEQAAVLKQQRAAEIKQAMASYQQDRSAPNLARLAMAFPELNDQIKASESILNEDEKKNANLLRSEVISLVKNGKRELARARLKKQLEGYQGTVGQEKQAKAAQDMITAFDTDPDLVVLPMELALIQSDKDLYEKVVGITQSLSPVGKEYQDRVRFLGKDEADAWLRLQGEKLIPVEEGGAVYKGSDLLGKGPITGKPAAKGITFKRLPAEGGQTDAPSGTF